MREAVEAFPPDAGVTIAPMVLVVVWAIAVDAEEDALTRDFWGRTSIMGLVLMAHRNALEISSPMLCAIS